MKSRRSVTLPRGRPSTLPIRWTFSWGRLNVDSKHLIVFSLRLTPGSSEMDYTTYVQRKGFNRAFSASLLLLFLCIRNCFGEEIMRARAKRTCLVCNVICGGSLQDNLQLNRRSNEGERKHQDGIGRRRNEQAMNGAYGSRVGMDHD